LKGWSTNFPEKILHATAETDDTTLDLWNVRAVPRSGWGEEKVKILETVYDRIVKTREAPCLLAGDFNAPDDELDDGTIVPFRSRTTHMPSGGPMPRRTSCAVWNPKRWSTCSDTSTDTAMPVCPTRVITGGASTT
jgi:hypothetical protein